MDKARPHAFLAGMISATLALLDGLGGPELLVIGLVVLLLFGSKRMPEIGRGLGRAIREFKRATSSVEENFREVLYEEPNRPKLRPPVHPRPHRTSPVSSVHTPAAASAESARADVPLNESAHAEPRAARPELEERSESAPRPDDSPQRG